MGQAIEESVMSRFTIRVWRSLLVMAFIRGMQCVTLMVVPGPVSTWWLCWVVCRVGRDIDSSSSLVCMSVCNPVK
jgi:hypothetical protein